MRVLSAEAMREVDRTAIEDVGLPSLVLMENAALGVAEAIGSVFPEAEAVAIFCGPGNNGGDGLALARHLDCRGYRVEVFLVGGKEPQGDAAVQLAVCHHQEISVSELADEDDLADALAVAAQADLVVDALFGTGLSRPLEGLFAELVTGFEELGLPVVAVDLPSGLNGSRAEIFGPAVAADATVTFAAPKIAHVLAPAADLVGELLVADLGIPPRLVDEVEEQGGDLHLLAGDDVAGLLPERAADSHKGDYGHLLVVAGAPGKAGAAVLAARAAVRGGAGLVTVAVPEPLLAAVDAASLESMTLPLAAGAGGEIAAAALPALAAAAEGKDAVALGPGLGQGEETQATIRDAVLACPLPLVLDADGLNAFAGRLEELARREAPTVLTPHPGELGRLLGMPTSEVQDDRLAAVRRAVEESGAVVVLKGHRTLIGAAADDAPPTVWVCPTGNPGMATGGSGDVLTGLVGALLARLGDPLAAALVGVYVHGLAGDLAAEESGETALAAGDLVMALG
ncbi:MAG TPA: NAD(P)H-hydrate dehydratase, partial [Thermoanaerobaculia bacterium]|nr:NAD(P)H-hydrate dehydratase [Thermoanaerobaculia bacterium]